MMDCHRKNCALCGGDRNKLFNLYFIILLVHDVSLNSQLSNSVIHSHTREYHKHTSYQITNIVMITAAPQTPPMDMYNIIRRPAVETKE